MSKEKPSSLQLHEEAKANLNQAIKNWEKTLNAYNRLSRERRQTKATKTDAEANAERAHIAAGEELAAAREHLRFVLTTVPKLKAKRESRRVNEEASDENDRL